MHTSHMKVVVSGIIFLAVLILLAALLFRDKEFPDTGSQKPCAQINQTSPETGKDEGPQSDIPAQTDTAVIVHSISMRTATVGREIADLMNAAYFHFNDGNEQTARYYETTRPLSAIKQSILDTVKSDQIKTVYIGFPIWGSQPTPFILDLVKELSLKGKYVIPFFTYLHRVEPDSIRSLTDVISLKEAVLIDSLALRFSFWISKQQVRTYTRQALHDRPDIWKIRSSPKPQVDCRPHPSRSGQEICRIPAGYVWVPVPSKMRLISDSNRYRLLYQPAFEMDRSEVSWKEYKACMDAGVCPERTREDGLCRDLISTSPDAPAVCTSAANARAFCEWKGLQTPTLPQWVRAARGDSLQPYPWGEDFSFSKGYGNFGQKRTSRYNDTLAKEQDDSEQLLRPDHKALAVPCSFPAGNSPFGVCDMAGNVGEVVDCPLYPGRDRCVLLGGSHLDADPYAFNIDHGTSFYPTHGFYVTGFRCVRNLDVTQ